MTRWLRMAKLAGSTPDTTDATDSILLSGNGGREGATPAWVLSVKSVVSRSVTHEADPSALPSATTATNRVNVGEVSDAVASKPTLAEVLPFNVPTCTPEPLRRDADNFPNGACRHTGRPRTWTGKVVNLEDWRGLSAWERGGPRGRLLCGICRNWVSPNAGCKVPGCWDGGQA